MFSARFQLPILVTHYARLRMAERNIDDALLLNLIETGTARHKDENHLWLFKSYIERDDNLLCAAAVLQRALVIKTVMHRFDPEPWA